MKLYSQYKWSQYYLKVGSTCKKESVPTSTVGKYLPIHKVLSKVCEPPCIWSFGLSKHLLFPSFLIIIILVILVVPVEMGFTEYNFCQLIIIFYLKFYFVVLIN